MVYCLSKRELQVINKKKLKTKTIETTLSTRAKNKFLCGKRRHSGSYTKLNSIIFSSFCKTVFNVLLTLLTPLSDMIMITLLVGSQWSKVSIMYDFSLKDYCVTSH